MGLKYKSVTLLRNPRLSTLETPSSCNFLSKFDITTRISEAWHVFAEAYLATIVTLELSQGDIKSAIFNGALLLGNTYCIMTQRYNRARLHNVIDRIEAMDKMPAHY